LEIAQGVLARVGLEIGGAAAALRHLEAEDVDGEPFGAGEVARAEAAIDDVLELDHSASPPMNSRTVQGEPQAQCESAPSANWRGPRAAICGPSSVSAA